MTKNFCFSKYIIFFLLFFATEEVFSQIKVSPLTAFESWNVAIIGLKTDDFESLDFEQKRVSATLKPILASVIKDVDIHYLSTEEKQTAQQLKKTDALSILNTQLEAIVNRDDIDALGNEKLDIWVKRLETRKSRKALERRIRKIKRIDVSDIEVERKLPVKIIEQTTVNNISSIENFKDLAVKLNAHSLIYYQVQTIESYVLIECFEYNILTQRSRKVLRTIVDPDNIVQIFTSLQIVMPQVILGTETASLDIVAQGADGEVLYDAKIILDGEEVGFGTVSLAAIPSGTHAINVVFEDQQRSEVLVLDRFESAVRTYLFEIEVKDTITIQSSPSNVKVYINSEWVGSTPLVIPKPFGIVQMEIREPGYVAHRATLSNLSASIYSVTLNPVNAIPLADRLERDRRKFYNAFGIFAISLAAPVILNGFYVNEVNAYSIGGANLSSAGFSEYQRNANIFFYSYLGTAAVSTGLGVFTYIRLRKYLKTASEYHER